MAITWNDVWQRIPGLSIPEFSAATTAFLPVAGGAVLRKLDPTDTSLRAGSDDGSTTGGTALAIAEIAYAGLVGPLGKAFIPLIGAPVFGAGPILVSNFVTEKVKRLIGAEKEGVWVEGIDEGHGGGSHMIGAVHARGKWVGTPREEAPFRPINGSGWLFLPDVVSDSTANFIDRSDGVGAGGRGRGESS
ncbi:hypothetical protein JK358_35670 [Nocardia sp. 2]|uniref:Uncharacterized protein n=1 Tax=Nocardia acididurans TaxID=2802282 RepID=A0ABS1MGP6_9NOCA|nr:hypothetical protein [Nocardia acididurans]MBL1079754.1 hypothetical protein [Nocardia acididurans]